MVVIILIVSLSLGSSSSHGAGHDVGSVDSPAVNVSKDGDGVKLATFLGTASRRFYGLGPAPRRLQVIWKARIGGSWTSGKFAGDANMSVGHRLDRHARPGASTAARPTC